MTPAYNRATTPESVASTCSQSDSESDSGMSLPHQSHTTPTYLLPGTPDDIPLFYFGLELEEEEIPLERSSIKNPSFSLSLSYEQEAPLIERKERSPHAYPTRDTLKRRNSNQETFGKKQKQSNVCPLLSQELACNDYFASDEESSDDEDSLSVRVARWNGAVDPFGFENTSTHLSALDVHSFSMGDSVSEDEDSESIVSLWEGQPVFDESSDEDITQGEDDDDNNGDDNEHEDKENEEIELKKKIHNKDQAKEDQAKDFVTLMESVRVPCRPTSQPTIYQQLTKASIDWCRYCGTTEGVNWRPGPWGKRTLCNKHGCDYKGYGFACKLPRLDLTGFATESIDDRDRPVLQLFCSSCQRQESWESNVLVQCEGCPKALHQECASEHHGLTDAFVASNGAWFCGTTCCENTRRKRIVVELPRKRLPLMCAPKNSTSASEDTTTRTRSLRDGSGVRS
ncbi:hypothetical protein BDF14DRAFT_282828 [Spinellus fusiger]|nr:hypothetical protein BDF14DRAFT_282828 [Spinellus fusiger]